MKRDWKDFNRYTLRSLKNVGYVLFLVPLFFFLLNPKVGGPEYWDDLIASTRIALQISLICWIGTALIYLGAYAWNPPLLLTLKKSVKFQMAQGLGLMILAMAFCSWAEPYISGGQFGMRQMSLGFLIGGLTLFAFIFYFAYRATREHNLSLAAESAVANLHVLKNQMQPHFLFNSLNTLAEMIEGKQENTADVVHKLSDLYREILHNSEEKLCSLESELAIIEKYLQLEKLRFGDRLDYHIERPADTGTLYLPNLILQTLVENALKHGLGKLIEGGRIQVSFEKVESGFIASVKNTGEIQTPLAGTGIGLKNTRERLRLLYGEKGLFDISSSGGHTEARFYFSGKKG